MTPALKTSKVSVFIVQSFFSLQSLAIWFLFIEACALVPLTEGLNGVGRLRLTAKNLAFLRLTISFFPLRLTEKLKINFLCFKKLNINKPLYC